MLDKAIRDLDRERAGLQSQEKKLIVEIKKMAKQNQMVSVPPGSKPPSQPWTKAPIAAHSCACLAISRHVHPDVEQTCANHCRTLEA